MLKRRLPASWPLNREPGPAFCRTSRQTFCLTLGVALCLAIYLTLCAPAARAGTFKPFLPYPGYDSVILNPFDPDDESARLLRIMQPFYARATGRSFTVQEAAGRGGVNAWADLASRGDDGYTLALTDLPTMAMFSLRTPPPFDPGEFSNVCLFAAAPLALWVPAGGELGDLYALVNQAFDNPGKVIIAGTGTFTPQHLASLRLDRLAGIKTGYRAHTGTGASALATAQGRALAFWAPASPAVATAGGFTPLAVAAEQRHPLFPDAPTFMELSYDLVETSYFGLAISSGTNPQTAQSVSAAFLNIARDPAFQERITAEGFFPTPVGAHEIIGYLQSLRDYYAGAIEEYGLRGFDGSPVRP